MDLDIIKIKTEIFISALHNGFFNIELYLAIEKELLGVANKYRESMYIEKEIVNVFYRFSESIISSFHFHINENDIFNVENIETETFKSYVDRVELLIPILLGVVSFSSQEYYFRN